MKTSSSLASATIALLAAGFGLASPPAAASSTIEICKQTKPAGGTGFNFDWSNGFGPQSAFVLNDGQCKTFDVTAMDKFNRFKENVPPGWTLAGIACNSKTSPTQMTGANPDPLFQPGDNMVSLDLNEPAVSCMFTNVQQNSGTATICVEKFDDRNGDGRREPGEPLLAGWMFEVRNAAGQVVAGTKTNPEARSCMQVKAPASYTVAEIQQSGWTPTQPATGSYVVNVVTGHTDMLVFGNRQLRPDGKCDLEIEKRYAPGTKLPLVPGQLVDFEIRVRNVGAGPCDGPIVIKDPLPPGLVLTNSSNPPWVCSGTVACTRSAPIPSHQGDLIRIATKFVPALPAPPIVKNCAMVQVAGDTNPRNNEACVELPAGRGK